jgi:transcriptional regulator with XRE-family HTH domain
MELRKVLGNNLKFLRQARRMSQETLAHEADIDRTYISSIERGVYATSIDVLDRLAKALGVEASELLRRNLKQITDNQAPESSDQN